MLGLLAQKLRSASSWSREKWLAFTKNPFEAWRPEIHVIGDTDSPLGPRVDVHVTAMADGVILTLIGHDISGNRAIHIGAFMNSVEALDLIVKSLQEARGKVWPVWPNAGKT